MPSQDGNKRNPTEVWATLLRALANKDLEKPTNWNLLLDSIMLFFIWALSVTPTLSEDAPLHACVITAFVFIAACIAWIMHLQLQKR